MISTPIRRTYSSFRGVDFANDPSLVLLSRSPDALNVWKNYKDTQGSCIETRPGYKVLAQFNRNIDGEIVEERINGIYVFKDMAFIHAKNSLYRWKNFPNQPTKVTDTYRLTSKMNDAKSSFAIFNENLYIVDGANYYVHKYEGRNVLSPVDKVSGTDMISYHDNSVNPSISNLYERVYEQGVGNFYLSSDTTYNPNKDYWEVEKEAYVPTTTISRSPSGGGEPYQDVNVLQTKRKNTFVADGTSTDYYLDTTEIDLVIGVKINGQTQPRTSYTVSEKLGKVTFNTAPVAPTLSGTDNVEILFSKTIEGYEDRIAKCTKMVVFDNRLFFAGNPDYPNAVFHSQLNMPNYVSDLAYYQDGTDESKIKALVVGNNILWVFKEPSQERDTIFYHTATTDSIGRVYPNFHGNISTGCCSDAINYKDDIVFLSKTGLEGISSKDISSQQLLNHKSSLVDNRLVNEENLELSMLVEWNGYLLILINSHIYLGDIRQLYQSINGFEYEWYYWDIENAQATILKEYKGNLYIGAEDGSIFIVEGTNDNGKTIESYWTTPMDNFGYGNKYKTTNKRGGVAKIKTIPNGKVKVAERTNKTPIDKYIKEFAGSGFDYGNFDYANFSYTATSTFNAVYKIKEKKFVELQLKFYSDELNTPFGIYDATIEAFEGGYVKR